MKLFEYEGKNLFQKYGIPILPSQLLDNSSKDISIGFPAIAKAQVRLANRKASGGIIVAKSKEELHIVLSRLLGSEICGEKVEKVLLEEFADVVGEYYVSFSYDTKCRGPVLAVNPRGGSGIHDAYVYGIDVLKGLTREEISNELMKANFPKEDVPYISEIVVNLWKLFCEEQAIVAEINPILKTRNGAFFAGDAKIDFGKRRTVEKMGGDIAIIASGGGASLINVDALILNGGRPANYAEYSGNPPKDVVAELTKQALNQPGIKGCWVVGGTANFTDILETMSGFVEGLMQIKPKPSFPFVIRRGGPRQVEAITMLKEFAKREGFEFYIYGPETPMVETAKIIVDLSYNRIKPNRWQSL